jgi:hypothetical protein
MAMSGIGKGIQTGLRAKSELSISLSLVFDLTKKCETKRRGGGDHQTGTGT